jgi:cytochrome c oxidase subunit II
MKLNLTMATITLSALALATTMLGRQPNESKPTQHIDVTAGRFSFEPGEITVKKGDPVTLTLRSKDVTHGLVIEDLGVRTEVKKGQEEELTLTPEKTGTFQGQCAHFCGKGHGSMTFTVHVVE